MATAKTKTVVVYKKAKKKNRRSKFTLPLAVVAGFAPGASRTIGHFQNGGVQGGLNELSRIYIGYDRDSGQFQPWLLRYGLYPVVAGVLIHKVAGLLGVNRMLARAGIPFIRI